MPNYNYLKMMTDDAGILQFSQKDNPDPMSGYTLDDNARALLVALSMGEEGYPYARIYTNYLLNAQQSNREWSNFLLNNNYSSNFDSEDSIGRAILACSLGSVSEWPDISADCSKMLANIVPHVLTFCSPRGMAYSLAGLCQGKIPYPKKRVHEIINKLSASLVQLFNRKKHRDWRWFEDNLSYCNAILPHALFSAYTLTGNKQVLRVADESLVFLNELLFNKGYLNIVGNQGWYKRGSTMPVFDQQPVDAASICYACDQAYASTGKPEYLQQAILAHQWFYGKNIHAIPLYNDITGGCYDALTEEGVNLNQGAEALVSLLLTDFLMESYGDKPANILLTCDV